MLSLFRWCAVLVLVFSVASTRAADFYLKNGDVVVMIGDNITEQHLYSNYVEMWSITRFPQWKLKFRNVGLLGDRAVGGNARFARDVLPYKPTVLTINFGLNDGGFVAFNEAYFKAYMDGLQGMATQAKAANIRVAWLTPQALDTAEPGPTALTGYNQTLDRFVDGVKEIADENGGLFIDQFHPYLTVLNAVRKKAEAYERITGGDGMHPGPTGQVLMAAAVLRGMDFPTLVSAVEINASSPKPKVVTAKNCTIEQAVKKNGGISFTRLDAALPFFPSGAAGILPHAPILDELNEYHLKVTGLVTGKYEVRVGGKKVAELTSQQLTAGANLASGVLANGPIADQVKAVQQAVEIKNGYHHASLFRGVTLTYVPEWVYEILPRDELEAKRKGLIDSRLAKLAEMEAELAKTIAPIAQTFEIVPVK